MSGMDYEWLEVALKSGDVGAWYWDIHKGKEIVRTEYYNYVYGLKADQIWTRDDWMQHIHPMDREDVVAKMQAAMDGAAPEYHAQYRVNRDDGSVRWVKAWGKGIRDSNGKVVRVAGVVRDITELKKVERDRDQFVATLSHDLRNPLSAARANVELLQKFPNQISEKPKFLDKVVAAIERADRIIQDLLDSSRAQSGKPVYISYQACDLRLVLLDAIEDLSLQYGDRFRFETSGEFAGTWACEGVRRVLENLAVNAIKYGATHEPVRIDLSRTLNIVSLSVQNQGNPIPDDEQKTLFEPFKRALSAEAGQQQGWGLGLTVVHSVADSLHGHVTVKSGTDIGTTFRLEFPTLT